MDGQEATLESVWRAATGGPITDALLEWPPDVFALTEILLEQSEAYRFVVSPPPGQLWPPAHLSDWAEAVVAAGAAWTASIREGADPSSALVADAWSTVRQAVDTPLETIADGGNWPTCEALLTLHAVADEACAGMGVAVEGLGASGCAGRGRGRELLARTGSMARTGRPGVRVLPKVRTPAGGISMR